MYNLFSLHPLLSLFVLEIGVGYVMRRLISDSSRKLPQIDALHPLVQCLLLLSLDVRVGLLLGSHSRLPQNHVLEEPLVLRVNSTDFTMQS